MTQTTALSTRIAHLEALALPLPELRSARDVLNVQRDEVQANITQAERAQQHLDLIGLHVGAVLDGDDITIEITGSPELPDTHETSEPEPAETEASPEPVREEEPAAPDTADELTEPLEPEPEPQTASARILEYLAAHPASTANEVAEGTGVLPKTANAALSKLKARGEVTADGWPFQYTLVTVNPAPVEETALQTTQEAEYVSSEPRGRTPDERAVLERLADGALYSVSHLIHHLGIARTRVERATNGLCQDGLIGRRGELFVVIPQELIGEAAS